MKNSIFKILVAVIVVMFLVGIGFIFIPPFLQDKQLNEEAKEYDELLSLVAVTPEETPETESLHETPQQETELITEEPTATETPQETQVTEEPESVGEEWNPFAGVEKKHNSFLSSDTEAKEERPSDGNGLQFGKYNDNTDIIEPVENADKYNKWLTDKLKTPTPSPAPTPAPTPTPEPRIGKYTNVNLDTCVNTNKDFIAWLKIPGTNVDYPVVHSNDVEHYLTHTFTGAKSDLGTIFSLGKTNWKRPSRNIVLYGHHVEGSGNKMFKALLQYKKQEFFDSHRTIYLDSLYHSGVYEVFAAFDMTEGDMDPSVTNFGSDAEFLDFVYWAKDNSLVKSDIILNEESQIITMVTCDRYFKRGVGRLVVMAVKVG